jgi:hypothetical protein
LTTPWTMLRVASAVAMFTILCSSSARAQQAIANRNNVVVHRDPSTKSPALEHLQKGARLVLVDANPDVGFYHVQTEDDQVGWVLVKYVTVSSTPVNPTPVDHNPVQPGSCDPALLAHVYHPNRLIVNKDCITVTGTIVDATANENTKQQDGVRHEPDGDSHGWLKVDPQFQNLLNAGNISAEDGNLVFEIICRYPITQADAKSACQGYTDKVSLPAVGTHVQIVGRYVQDTFHAKWMEIHPVTTIIAAPAP